MQLPYVGRIAPSPTGLLHLGHAATFWQAFTRAREHHGIRLAKRHDALALRTLRERNLTPADVLAHMTSVTSLS